ncbi:MULTISPECIES: DUF721 domain-containing protein [Enterovibrio]|uniref:RNA-binding protein n=1 Tax=Enterovibrio norvegicus FF-454 TaxID=1185651 RepID=A0A1E5BXE9_9GAMM|nr:DciA family protein [Enterovibrio norvegicus]OEE57908.1 hypothetical protein A1OK_04560 [Enterovibrio norvegicus FF-454]OEE87387.1 hypothetical protein A1OQ_15480 [Enterovibrio norvegicus FF-162]
MRDHRPKAAQDLLENGLTGQVRQRAMVLSQLSQQVKALLPPASAEHCRVANYRDGILVLECGSSSWATRLNYDRHTLMSALRRGTLPSLMTIEIKVNPELARRERAEAEKVEKAKEWRTVSPAAAEYLKAIAQSAPDNVRKKLEAIAELAERNRHK